MRSNSKPVTQRQLRVGEQVRHIIAECFERGNLPTELYDLPTTTIMEAKISSDFSFVKIYVSFLVIDPVKNSDLVKKMNENTGFFRGILGRKMRLRITPEVRFYADEAQAEADRIEALLNSEKVQRDLAAPRDDVEE
ncbi:MAG: 30S ribosome-binding factor RbfA [Alphaproteobacteria bacterium]|nr:30S ribosome-binding factor RbfA [Alphaproteobacteria bacterium]